MSSSSGMTQLLFCKHHCNRLVLELKVAFVEHLLRRVSHCLQYTFL